MNCRCDIESHGHMGVCNKKVGYKDSQMWESCDHIHIVKDEKGLIEDKIRNRCFCVKNRCCNACWEKEFKMAKGYLMQYLRVMKESA